MTTHLENMRRNDALKQQQNPDTDDEKVNQIGKSNLDKWLQALLLKGMESAGSSPGRDTPLQILSPALSQISVAAMRESLERARQQVRNPNTLCFPRLPTLIEKTLMKPYFGSGAHCQRQRERRATQELARRLAPEAELEAPVGA